MAEHTIFSGAPPWEPTAFDDGDPSITTAVSFYSTVPVWVVGGRIRVPVGDVLLPANVTISLRTAATFAAIDLSTAPVASGVAVKTDGWVEVRFASAVPLPVGTVAWISLDAGDAYLFVDVGTVGLGPVQADDGFTMWLSEAGTSPGIEQIRSAFRIGAGATTNSQAWYGIDIIVSDVDPSLGDAALGAQADITAAGTLGVVSSSALGVSASLSAAGVTGGSGAATINEEVTVVASGVVSGAPNPGGVMRVVELLSDILDLLTSEESDGGCPLPCFCRVAVYPGLEVPWDSCSTGGSCGECDGQLYAAIQSVVRVAGDGVGACQAYQFTAIVGAVRCAAKMKDDDLNPFPSVEAVQNDAIRQAVDADGIRYAIECCPTRPRRLKDAGIVLERWDPLGPQDCVGGAWTIRGRFDVCC